MCQPGNYAELPGRAGRGGVGCSSPAARSASQGSHWRRALRQIAELEFDKFELALVENGQHLKPSEAGDNPEAALQRLRRGPSLIPSSLYLDFGTVDWSDPVTRTRFDGLCRLAKSLSVAVLTIHAAPTGTPVQDEIKRLAPLVSSTMRQGLVLALLTHSDTLDRGPQGRRGAVPGRPRAWS